MIMVDDMGGWGVDTKITDYVDMGRGLCKVDTFSLKVGYTINFWIKCLYF